KPGHARLHQLKRAGASTIRRRRSSSGARSTPFGPYLSSATGRRGPILKGVEVVRVDQARDVLGSWRRRPTSIVIDDINAPGALLGDQVTSTDADRERVPPHGRGRRPGRVGTARSEPSARRARIAARQDLRWVLAQMFEDGDRRHPLTDGRALRARTRHIVEVEIGPARAGLRRAEGGAPIDDLLGEQGPKTLHLVFTPPSGHAEEPRSIALPTRGRSEARQFIFATGKAGAIEEITIEVL